jgi:hypothetical protein
MDKEADSDQKQNLTKQQKLVQGLLADQVQSKLGLGLALGQLGQKEEGQKALLAAAKLDPTLKDRKAADAGQLTELQAQMAQHGYSSKEIASVQKSINEAQSRPPAIEVAANDNRGGGRRGGGSSDDPKIVVRNRERNDKQAAINRNGVAEHFALNPVIGRKNQGYDHYQFNEVNIALAYAAAKRENLPMLLEIGPSWCTWCHKKGRDTMPQAREALDNKAVVVHVDPESAAGQVIMKNFTNPPKYPATIIAAVDDFKTNNGQPVLHEMARDIGYKSWNGSAGFKAFLESKMPGADQYVKAQRAPYNGDDKQKQKRIAQPPNKQNISSERITGPIAWQEQKALELRQRLHDLSAEELYSRLYQV